MMKIPLLYKNIAKVIIGIGLLTWLLLKIDLQSVFLLMRQGDPLYLICGMSALFLAFSFLQAARLHWCIRNLTGSLGPSIRLFFIGFLFNNLLPTNIGGDAVRLFYLQKFRKNSWGHAAALLFIYRISGLLVLLAGGLAYLFFFYSTVEAALTELGAFNLNHGIWAGLIAAALLLGAGLIFIKKTLRNKLKNNLNQSLHTFRLFHAWEYAGILCLAAAFHLARIAGFYFLLLYFGTSVEMIHLVFVLAVTALISLIPVSFGALGLMEGAITGSLMLFGIPPDAAAGTALVNRFILILIAAAGAIVYLNNISAYNPPQATEDTVNH